MKKNLLGHGRIMWNTETPVKGFSIGQVVNYMPCGGSLHRCKICKIEIEDCEPYYLLKSLHNGFLLWADFSELRPHCDGGIFKKNFGGAS